MLIVRSLLNGRDRMPIFKCLCLHVNVIQVHFVSVPTDLNMIGEIAHAPMKPLPASRVGLVHTLLTAMGAYAFSPGTWASNGLRGI